ncbi:hypothetical protein JY531_09580 [Serratia marcescens]|uniref:hypothetical protein n=1 Tax=Serratia TaxID=613 RepID=UPI0018D688D5|nr:hypothetical protein [Serratia marcescens]MBH2804689.1 hypothetical protein [Serratia marcescens]MBH2958154.1 hypothetical protein [Serratia marcescens]MBN5235512.1 hypothetical protein [Serratia marcescens]MBN5367798.1 hypothetical protein [Serratia marcescens]
MEIRTARLSDRHAIAELMTTLDYPGTEAFLTQRMHQLLAHRRGCDRLEVHCHSRRERAHAFYRREGFVEAPKYFAKLLNQ